MRRRTVGRSWPRLVAFQRLAHGWRRWALLGALVVAFVAGGVWMLDPSPTVWTSTAVLRTRGDTWPLAFSPDGRTFASWGFDGITLWDSRTGVKQALWDQLEDQFAGAGAYAPDGKTFAAAIASPPRPVTVCLIDVDTGRVTAKLPTSHAGLYSLGFADDGRTVSALLGDVRDGKAIVTWDRATGEERSNRPVTCRTSGCDTAVSPDGRLLAVAAFRGHTMRVWDLDADCERNRFTYPQPSPTIARGFGFSPDSSVLVVGREDGSFDFWDVNNAGAPRSIRGDIRDRPPMNLRVGPGARTIAWDSSEVRPKSLLGGLRLALSRRLFGRNWNPAPEVIVMDAETGECLARAPGAVHVYYSPDGATIATRETDLSIRLRPNPAGR